MATKSMMYTYIIWVNYLMNKNIVGSTCDDSKSLVTIITPVFNAKNYIRETIESVLNQKFHNIEYIIIDGGSSDGTVDIIREYNDRLAYWVSERDSGMYDALCKGFEKASGNIVGYINAGDFFNPMAIQVVVEQFENNNVSWLTGMRTICNENSEIISCSLPFRYKSNLIRMGCYIRHLPFIQQESTFWHSSLLKKVDFDLLRGLRLAGDYYLWYCFSSSEQLSIVSSQLGVFKRHYGQLSSDIDKYVKEAESFCNVQSVMSKFSMFIEYGLWALHPKLRKLFADEIITFDTVKNKWTQ